MTPCGLNVHGGYRLIVRTDGKQIDTSVYLEELTISERSFIIELSLILSENLGGAHEKKR
ncbi:hypothetical protein [Desulfosporosinus sp. OT]|uniref:hypothetical protein n=1 Tax=Desulfosporosinus sp. OT TaxID=913865 RepID=UPI000223A9A3|nr:hypothetical protein [Desulfosporosinus sp. OT]EGW37018.1 hypothetical protein DOT_5103 [Desulfosporosinus sp. OT]